MNRRNFLSIIPAAVAMAAVPGRAFATVPVVEVGANLIENTISAIKDTLVAAQTAISNVNEATIIYKQFSNLPFEVITQFQEQFTDFFAQVNKVRGLIAKVEEVESKFTTLYPDFDTVTNVSGAQMLKGMRDWRKHLDNSIKDSMTISAQYLKTTQASQRNIKDTLWQSQGAIGDLQVAQAGNQLVGKVAGELLQLNAQMAAYQNAHLEYIAETKATEEANRNAAALALVGIENHSTVPPVPRPGHFPR